MAINKSWQLYSRGNLRLGKGAIPERKHKKALHKFFSVPMSKNLEECPLFLSLSPIDLNSQKSWLCDRIKNMSDHELDLLFPALAKLLAEE